MHFHSTSWVAGCARRPLPALQYNHHGHQVVTTIKWWSEGGQTDHDGDHPPTTLPLGCPGEWALNPRKTGKPENTGKPDTRTTGRPEHRKTTTQ